MLARIGAALVRLQVTSKSFVTLLAHTVESERRRDKINILTDIQRHVLTVAVEGNRLNKQRQEWIWHNRCLYIRSPRLLTCLCHQRTNRCWHTGCCRIRWCLTRRCSRSSRADIHIWMSWSGRRSGLGSGKGSMRTRRCRSHTVALQRTTTPLNERTEGRGHGWKERERKVRNKTTSTRIYRHLFHFKTTWVSGSTRAVELIDFVDACCAITAWIAGALILVLFTHQTWKIISPYKTFIW